MNNEDRGKNASEQPKINNEEDLDEERQIEEKPEEKVEMDLTLPVQDAEGAPVASKEEVLSAAQNAAEDQEEPLEKLENESASEKTLSAGYEDVSKTFPEDFSNSVDRAAEGEQANKLESPIFKELASPRLPQLAPENRARLQMQSPNRIFFYWSIKNNPYETLHKALGAQSRNYRLVARLVNLREDKEEIYPVEAEGSWWFDVEAGAPYRVDVGFYASNRPFIRLVFSNTVETPRAAPSPNLDLSPAFAVSASEFAEALGASGYREDAFDVALGGNDAESADEATNAAFEQIVGDVFDPSKFAAAELRSVLYALATGAALEDLRAGMTPLLFDYLVNILEEKPNALDAENILPVWESSFGTEHTEEMRMQRLSATVFGASSINFPRVSGPRKPKLAPVSSLR